LDSEVLSSVELIEQLINLDHGIWVEYHNGKPIGTRALSKLLGDFGIGPRTVRRGGSDPKRLSQRIVQRCLGPIHTCVPRLENATSATLQCLCA
jgi:hypothetical protein